MGSIFCLNNHDSNLIFSDCFGNRTHKEVVFTIWSKYFPIIRTVKIDTHKNYQVINSWNLKKCSANLSAERLLNIDWTFTERLVNVHWTFNQDIHTECSVKVHWTFSERPLNVLWTLSLNVHWTCISIVAQMFSKGSVKVHWTSTERSLNVVSERSVNGFFSVQNGVSERSLNVQRQRSANVQWTFAVIRVWSVAW